MTPQEAHVYISVRDIRQEGQVSRWEGVIQRGEAAQTSQSSVQVFGGPLALIFVGVITLALVGGVILPAVWSCKSERRSAAFKVMDRIFKLVRPRS
jgi:hypothetical protein